MSIEVKVTTEVRDAFNKWFKALNGRLPTDEEFRLVGALARALEKSKWAPENNAGKL